MLKRLLRIFIAIELIASCSAVNAQKINYTITGKVGQYSAPAKAYLYYSNASGKQIDSTIFRNGTFTFSGKLDQPRPALIYISKTGAGLESSEAGLVLFYLEQGNIFIKSTGALELAEVSGGPINTDNNKLNALLSDNTAELKKINTAYASLSANQVNLNETRDSIVKKRELLVEKRKTIYFAFIKENPSSMMSLFALKNYERPVAYVANVERIFNLLSANIRTSKAGQSYGAEISRMKHIEIGAVAPDFTLANPSGKMVSLHDYRGKYVLIDFWASWCLPCRADNPNVLKVYSAFKDKNLIVLSVSLDDVKSKWLTAIQEDKLPWLQLSDLKGFDPEGVAKLYTLDGIPQNFLIDSDGKIIDKATTTFDLPGKLKNILN